eukprot:scaffold199204_cov35-Tisochrysis_lutea.AAC.2
MAGGHFLAVLRKCSSSGMPKLETPMACALPTACASSIARQVSSLEPFPLHHGELLSMFAVAVAYVLQGTLVMMKGIGAGDDAMPAAIAASS